MQKTTIYLPDDLKRAIGRLAISRGLSEAELIRQAIRTLTSEALPPRPHLPLFKSGKPGLADDVEGALSGFGES